METIARELQERNEVLTQLEYHLAKAQDQMKQYDNKKEEGSTILCR